MRNFLLLLSVALVIGEVSGGIHVGLPAAQETPSPPPQNGTANGQFVFAALAAVAAVITVVAIRQFAR